MITEEIHGKRGIKGGIKGDTTLLGCFNRDCVPLIPVPKEPTRIIAPPVRVRGLYTEKILYPCDDGQSYPIRLLSEITGLGVTTLYSRIINLGWEHPDVLSRKLNTRKGCERRPAKNTKSEWGSLGDKVRSGNLARLQKRMGSWERQELGE